MEWFTAQDSSSTSNKSIWKLLTSLFVPVHAVAVLVDNPGWVQWTLKIIKTGASSDLFPVYSTVGNSSGSEQDQGENGKGAARTGGRGTGIGMPLEEYFRQLSSFDVVLAANSLDDLSTKVTEHDIRKW